MTVSLRLVSTFGHRTMIKSTFKTMFGNILHVPAKPNRNDFAMHFSTTRCTEEKLRSLLAKMEFPLGISCASKLEERHYAYKKLDIVQSPLLSMNAGFEEAEKYVTHHFYQSITQINKELNIGESPEESQLFASACRLLHSYQIVKGKGYEREYCISEEISQAYYGWCLASEAYLQKQIVNRVNEETVKRLGKAIHNIDVLGASLINAM